MNREKSIKNMELMKEFQRLTGFTVPHDKIMMGVGIYTIDILAFDERIEQFVTEYNSEQCTYNGKPEYSLGKMIKEHFGERAYDIIVEILKS